jgi:hypothetical protein
METDVAGDRPNLRVTIFVVDECGTVKFLFLGMDGRKQCMHKEFLPDGYKHIGLE